MNRSGRILSFLGCLMMTGQAPGVNCDAVFSNAVGTIGDKLKLDDSVSLINTGNRTLATADLEASGNFCDGQSCIEGGSHAPQLTLPANSTNTDLKNQSLSLAPGDYYYDKVDLKNSNTITITGSGQVRIHVRRDLKISDDARINVNGDPLNLIFLVGEKVDVKDDAQVKAVIYAEDQLKVEGEASLDGAVVGSGSEIKDDARVQYVSTGSLEIPGVCDAGSGGPIVGGQLNFKVEVGALTIINTYDKPDFTRVNFTQVFDDPPLVFTLPTTQGGNTAAHRVRNITADGFDIMTLEPLGEDGPHIAMSLNFLAIERGVHDLPGGRKLVADSIDTRRVQAYANAGGGIGWENINFGGVFSRTPAVLGQIQTMVNEQEPDIPSKPSSPWLTTVIDNVTTNSMRIALERSESVTGTVGSDETIAYLAVEPVDRMSFLDGSNQRVEMEVIRTDELLQGWNTCNANRVMFSAPWAQTPVVLATKNTRDGDSGSGDGDGGWLRRCSTSTTYTALQIDEVRRNNVGDRNRTHNVRERAGVVVFSGNFVTEARDLDHFRIEHDGSGVVGVSETVTVKACRNADCSQLYTGSVTVTMQPGDAVTSWSASGMLANQVTFSGGTQVVNLHRTAPGTFNLGLTATPTAQNPTRCFDAGVETCAMTFTEAGFNVVVPDQVSAVQSSGSVSVSTCTADFQSTTLAVDVSVQYVSPVWIGPALTVNSTALPTDGTPATINLVFDGSCVAPLLVDYTDAGEIELSLNFVGSGALSGVTIAGSDNAVFYPAALVVQAANSGGTLLNAAAVGALPIHVAADAFTLSISAINQSGNVTKGYEPQGIDRVQVYVQRTEPVPGFSGRLRVSTSTEVDSLSGAPAVPGDYSSAAIGPGDFVDGVYDFTQATYSEVGLITLHLFDSDYLGYPIGASPIPIGRFIPARFEASGTVSNRVATPGCGPTAPTFTYMDEGLRLAVELRAVNAASNLTQNYQLTSAPLNLNGFGLFAGTPGNTLGFSHAGTNLAPRIVMSSLGPSPDWAAGVGTLVADFTLQRAASPDGPFDGAAFGISVNDGDGVGVTGLDLDVDGSGGVEHLQVATTDLRFGRVAVGNAHGSELLDLDVPAVMQYYAGGAVGFETHGDDSCTAIASATLSDADTTDSLQVADTCIVDDPGASGGNACATGTAGQQYRSVALAGEFVINLKAPGATRTGSLNVTAGTPAWARFDWTGSGDSDAAGIATFGIYGRETGVIYQRELR